MNIGNLTHNIPNALPNEFFEPLLTSPAIKIERIVSKGHCSEPGFWYNQDENEWVLVIKGEAKLRFYEGERVVHLTEGMYINIPAHTKHRVDWTTHLEETIWLAVFY